MIFHEMSHFLQLFSKKFIETSKGNSLLEKLPVLAKSMIFRCFSRNEKTFLNFCPKISWKHDSLLERLLVLFKSMIFRGFSRDEPLYATFFRKVHPNVER